MEERKFRVYRYRWVVLLVFSLLQFLAILLNFTFAPITGEAAAFYGVSPMKIGFLATVSLILTIFLQIPGSYAVDTWGIRKAIGLGALLAGVFGFIRGLGGDSYTWVLISTWGFCLSNPVVFNSMTAVAARWFPVEQRATAIGIMLVAVFCGMMVGMGMTPLLAIRFGIPGMLKIYGIMALFIGVAFCAVVREAPPTPPAEVEVERVPALSGVRHMFTHRETVFLLVLWFVSLGAWNALMTWVEQIIAPRGFSSVQAGTVGAIMQAGGIAGCFLIPLFSERLRTRKLFFILSILSLLVGLAGLGFAGSYALLLASVAVYGFFNMGGSSVTYQYAAELSYPAPEATSQGLLIWVGQISGVIFIYGLDMFRTGSGAMTPFLVVMMVLTLLVLAPMFRMRESPMVARGPVRQPSAAPMQ
ncbi:MAG: MFS transporter [bacterium]